MKFLLVIAVAIALVNCQEKMKKFKDAKLNFTASNELGDAMFEMMPEKDVDEKKAYFGISQLMELDKDGNAIETAKHSCDFKKSKDDESPVTCTVSEPTDGTYNGENDNAEAIEISYKKVTHTCALSSCNAPDAKLMVHSYVFKGEGYICMEGCDKDDSDEDATVDKSPVFNGTAKFTVEITGWNFCTTATCDGKDATKFKMLFSAYSSSKKKGTKMPKKKARKEFKAGKNCTALMDKIKEQAKNKDDVKKLIKKKGKPALCKDAINTMRNKSETQDRFTLGDDNDEKAPIIRLFPIALIDGVRKAETDGVSGPTVETVTRKLKNGDTKSKDYIAIVVPKFTTLKYDPSVEMSAQGGTEGENNGVAATSSTLYVVFLSALLAFLYGN